jgi:hypothetical protein
MVNGMVKDAQGVHHGRDHALALRFTLSLHRVRRQHRRWSGAMWPCPRCNTPTACLSCSEFTGVPLITAARNRRC